MERIKKQILDWLWITINKWTVIRTRWFSEDCDIVLTSVWNTVYCTPEEYEEMIKKREEVEKLLSEHIK